MQELVFPNLVKFVSITGQGYVFACLSGNGPLIKNLSTIADTLARSRKQITVKTVSLFGSMEIVSVDSHIAANSFILFCMP